MSKNTKTRIVSLSKIVAKAEEGFSLIEMLIVISIIALIGVMVGRSVIGKYTQAKVDATKIQMRQVLTLLDDFKRVCGYYPTTEQGLDVLVKAPVGGRECKNYPVEGITTKVPKDGFDNDFHYSFDGRKPLLVSLGDDNAEGGDGYAKDLKSDELD